MPENKPIPIVYVIDHFYRGGGTENQLAILIDNMDRTGFTPYVFNLRPKLPEMAIEIDCPVEYLNVESLLSLSALRAVFRVWRHLRKNKVKILQVYFMDSRAVGVMAGKLAGVRNIVACRRDMGWWHTPRKVFLMRTLGRFARYCLVNAQIIKKMVLEVESFAEDKIRVIYNGVKLAPRPDAPEVSRERFGIPESVPVVGMVGNLRQVKRYDRLVRVAELLRHTDAHFLFIGYGEEESNLKRMVAESNAVDRIHFFHTVKGVYDILQLFDVGVLTSQSEGLSNVLIEYALAGLPTVAFDVGGNSEVVIDGETGYVLPDGDETQMAQRIDHLLDSSELRAQFGRRARELAHDKFDVEQMVQRTQDFYEEIVQAS